MRATRDATSGPPRAAGGTLKRPHPVPRDVPHLALANVTLDVTDMDRAMGFWTAALGYEVVRRDEYYAALEHPTDLRRMRVGLQPTDEPKRATNHMHLDLETDNMHAEAKRLEALGATRADDWPYPDDKGGADCNWIVMRDPDGNEFCVTEREHLRFATPP